MSQDSSQTSKPDPEVLEKERIELRLALAPMPSEVSATNLELRAAAAAMKAACELNERYRTVCVEVFRKTKTNAPDGGEDVVVDYNDQMWKSPQEFQDEFFPLYDKYRRER